MAILLVINYNKRKRQEAFYSDTGLYKEDAFFLDTQAVLLQNTHKKYGIIYMNITNFSRINSYFGTNAGDKVLDQVGINLNNILKDMPDDFAGYQHGDKYMILLKGDIEDVLYKLQEINDKLINCEYDFGQRLEFSYGIKITDSQYAIDLRGEWDCAKYAENNSKNNEVFNNYDQEMINRKKEIEDINGRFDEALLNEEFEVFLQLKWSLTKNDWAGAEALCRWRDPIKGLISPGVFIPIFEENGKIVKLDCYMFESTCKLLTTFIKIFHENDFSISMDDFGAGYSSLNMIHELDFDVIKIDARFFRGGFDEANQIIVSSIINLCHQLNKIVVAEGVENPNEVEFLRGAGCDIVQGYYFAKPLPVEDFKKLLFSKPNNN